jgi:xanthine dehydrogenase accessory factor
VFDFALDNESAAEAGAICGGTMRILIDPTAAEDRDCYHRASETLEHRRRGVLVTTIRSAEQVEVTAEWFEEGALPGEMDFPPADTLRACLAREAPRLLAGPLEQPGTKLEAFVEPVIARPRLLIAGAGHVGRALARQAVVIGFEVTVIDDRAEFADAAAFPDGVTVRCGEVPRLLGESPMDKDTYVVIVTRGHRHDAEALRECIHRRAAYVGMIGSRRKVAMIRESFLRSGLATEEELDRVFAPIGLDIGAVTVPEISVSIAAELIAVRRKCPPSGPPTHMAEG